MRSRIGLLVLFIGLGIPAGGALARARPAEADPDLHLAAAKAFVEKSDKYLHHSRLRRGMRGYGLTVMAGTKIVRFDAEIVSVVTNWGAKQDVILAMLTKQKLETSGIISGMSGSPVYIRDPRDGKYKMIGAVAYGWMAPEGAALRHSADHADARDGRRSRQGRQGPAPAPNGCHGACARRGGRGEVPRDDALAPQGGFLHVRPESTRAPAHAAGAVATSRADSEASDRPRLVALKTPLMISAPARGPSIGSATLCGRPGSFPCAAGAGGVDAAEAAKVKLEPGSAIAMPLASGDVDWCAVGTVTDVIGDRVLAFGHAFNGEGDIELPMGTGYVHTVVSGVLDSFKMASSIKVTGTLVRDESVGVAGRVGAKVKMVPMTVEVNWVKDKRTFRYAYRIAKERFYLPMIARYLVYDSVAAWRVLPEFHTVRHKVTVDFGKLGKYTAANIASDSGVYGSRVGCGPPDLRAAVQSLRRRPFPRGDPRGDHHRRRHEGGADRAVPARCRDIPAGRHGHRDGPAAALSQAAPSLAGSLPPAGRPSRRPAHAGGLQRSGSSQPDAAGHAPAVQS